MWSGNFKSAVTNLRQSKWRSFLTMLGIIIGISSVVTIVSLGEGLKHQIVGQINHLGPNVITVRSGKLVNNDGTSLNLLAFFNSSTLTLNDYSAVAKLPSVSNAAPMAFVTNSAVGDKGEQDNLSVIGTTSGLLKTLGQKVNYGVFFDDSDTSQNNAVIGSDVAQQLFGEIAPVGHTLKINGKVFLVSGVLSPSSGGLLSIAATNFNSAILIPLPVAKNLSSGQLNVLQILAKSKASDPDMATQDIKNALLRTHVGTNNFTVLKQSELLDLSSNVLNVFTTFIAGIAAISLLVGGIGVMDIMLVSVSERTREIGVRKALGATNRQILNQFLVEGLTLTFTGGLLGIILSFIIYGFLKLYSGLQPVIDVWVMVLTVILLICVGLVFSVVPAAKAARKNPIDALRGE